MDFFIAVYKRQSPSNLAHNIPNLVAQWVLHRSPNDPTAFVVLIQVEAA